MFKLEKRLQPSQKWSSATPFLAVAGTMVFGGIMFFLLGIDPYTAIRIIFWDPLFNPMYADYARPQILIKAGPLILIAIGLAIGFKANVWNIGAEGQYIIGAIFGAGVGLAFYPNDAWYIFPLMVVAGAFGGFIWAMIPALLKIKFNTNEILVSLMLVYVAEKILVSMSLGLLRNPEGGGFPGSRNLQYYDAAANRELITGTGLHWGVLFASGLICLMYIMLNKHLLGYQIKISGQSQKATRFSGTNPSILVAICFGISGGLAGLAGLFEVSGPSGQISIDFNVGYGFTAIIVAFLGRLNPIGILLAGLLMALTYIGGELAQFILGLPAAAIQAFQGMLLFFLLAGDIFTNYKIKLTKKGGTT